MQFLLRICGFIDRLNTLVGKATAGLVLLAVLVSVGNALGRYVFERSSNAWLELQWYLIAAVFLLCAGYTLLQQQHVKIDILYSRLSRRTQLKIDIFGAVFFLLPVSVLILWLSWPVFVTAFTSGEVSSNTGGLPLWWARLLVPVGFLLLVLQGFSEIVKRVAILRGDLSDALADAPPPANAAANSP